MKHKNYFWGILLVVIGAVGILDKVFHISLDFEFWPLFVLIPGLCFEIGYFTNKDKTGPGVLVPGGILTTIGLLFVFETLTNWRFSEYTWPIYTLAVAIGLFQLYWFGERERGLLIPIGILTAITIVAFISMICGNVFYWMDKSAIVPIVLFAVGIWLIVKKGHKTDD